MKELVVENKAGNYAEILTDYDYDTFKYEYEKIMNVQSLSQLINQAAMKIYSIC